MIDIIGIMKFLPHRYPFLLVDRVLELIPGEKIVALKNVTINEPFFQGHYPGAPVMPGVLIVEAMGQAGGVLAYASHAGDTPETRLIYFAGIDKVRFRKPVIPGDQLIMELKIMKRRMKMIKMSGIAKVEGKLVAEAELMATF
jgi:3-hydroxyacyl-[acyl-carrier-protein] dehydratase